MKFQVTILFALPFALFLSGCGETELVPSVHAGALSEEVQMATSGEETPSSKSDGATPAPSLPGMNCLVDEHGIRMKVIATQPEVPCFDGPEGNHKIGTLRYFRPYFVFAIHPEDGKPAKAYRVGISPSADSIIGWAPAASLSLWPTRLGARLVSDLSNGSGIDVYRSKDDLLAVLQNGSPAAEPLARTPAEMGWVKNAWPISSSENVEVQGQLHQIVQVQFLGRASNSDATAREDSAVSSPDYSTDEVNSLLANLQTLDIVFVIDVTGSMAPYLDAVRQVVAQIAQRFSELPVRPDVAFGLVAYRDYDYGPDYVTREFDLERDCNVLLQHTASLEAGEGGDNAEAVYDGVHAALTKISWRGNRLAQRAILLIGDCSAHEPGEVGNPKGISRDDLVAQSAAAGVRVYGLAVGGVEEHPERQRRRAQFDDLTRRTGGVCFTPQQAEDLSEQLLLLAQEHGQNVVTRSNVFEGLAAGQSAAQVADDARLRIEEVTQVMEFLKGAGIDLQRLNSGQTKFSSGWVEMEQEGLRVLRREVFMCRSELDYLLASLNLLSSNLGPGLARHAFGVGLAGRIFPTANLMDTDMPLDVWLMAQGVPAGQTSLLRLQPSEIQHMPEERRAQLRDKIARELIPALVQARNDNRLWVTRDGLEWGWVDESILP